MTTATGASTASHNAPGATQASDAPKSPYTIGGNAYIPHGTEPVRTPLTKYVFIQDESGYLPRVLDKYLREFADSTAGVNIQPITQAKKTFLQTLGDFYRIYGPVYFARKCFEQGKNKVLAKLGMGKSRSVRGIAAKYGVAVTGPCDVNSEEFLAHLREKGVQFIVSISGTQLYKKKLREQTPYGIVNCHGALLPKYRGLMPSFWTLANGEREGGVSVHFVDYKLDNGPIVVQKRYRIHSHDTLEDVMARSKDLAAEAIIECVRKVEDAAARGAPPEVMANPESEMSHFSMPTAADIARFRQHGHRFF